MSSSAALIAAIVRIERSATPLAARWPSAAATTTSAESTAALPSGQLYPHAPTTHGPPIKATDRIFGVPGIIELHEGESRRVPGHPNIPQRAVVRECIFDFLLAGVVTELTNVNLGVVWIARHFL